MREQQSSPRSDPAGMASTAGAAMDDVELSDEDLEHVVGGLARAWLAAAEPPSVVADGGPDAYAGPSL